MNSVRLLLVVSGVLFALCFVDDAFPQKDELPKPTVESLQSEIQNIKKEMQKRQEEELRRNNDIRYSAVYAYLLNAPWAMFAILLAAVIGGGFLLRWWLFGSLKEKLGNLLERKMNDELKIEDDRSEYAALANLAFYVWELAEKLPGTPKEAHLQFAISILQQALTHAERLPDTFDRKGLYLLNARQSLAYFFAELKSPERRTDALRWSQEAYIARDDHPSVKHNIRDTYIYVRIMYSESGVPGANELLSERQVAIEELKSLLEDPALPQGKAAKWRKKYQRLQVI